MILPRRPQTVAAVAGHYDELDPFYRDIWGEHVHHGYWASGRESPAQAADALVDLVAERLRLGPGLAVCDIGCGYGAAARRIAERFGCAVTALTVSPAQAALAAQRSVASGSVSVLLRDWLHNDFPDAHFDRAYAVESTEHMPDKQRVFDEAFRTLRPGGVLVVCAWLARAGARAWEVRHLLEPICREGRLPGMGEETEYADMARRAGFHVASVEDISERVRRTWSICVRRVLGRFVAEPCYRRFLFDGNARNRVFVVTMLRLSIAYRTGSMRYCLFVFER
ncbi:MAG TPA: class I SAM-dependent methyltransferase [Acidisphaera sp.]|nr:class I SAM-dependent methyltransferase [Acidisphaera sp.]